MCCAEDRKRCQCPSELKGTPKDCTPEQIKKCHGSEKDHPCTEEEKKE
jgi:hypothetical protein